jgi:hypothetical protein
MVYILPTSFVHIQSIYLILSDLGQLSIASKQPETTSSPMNSSSDSKSDLGVYNPYEQPRQSSDSASTVHPPSNLKNISVPKTLADQNSLKAPSQGLQRHTVDRNARDETIRLERLMSPDDEQDSLLDPSQGVTSLMDMIQLVQLTKTEKSTKTRMVILQKIIQTDDIALLQKYIISIFSDFHLSFTYTNCIRHVIVTCPCVYLCHLGTFFLLLDLSIMRRELAYELLETGFIPIMIKG